MSRRRVPAACGALSARAPWVSLARRTEFPQNALSTWTKAPCERLRSAKSRLLLSLRLLRLGKRAGAALAVRARGAGLHARRRRRTRAQARLAHARRSPELVERVAYLLCEQVEVRHRVVVAEQAEVQPAGIAHHG